jgi:hypothetical protein
MSANPSNEEQALLEALQGLLLPIGRLLVDRGVHFAEVEERLKMAMIQAAREAALKATPQALPHRLVSRIATSTGINRREVTRLVHTELKPVPARRSLALEVYVHWLTDPLYRDRDGRPQELPRQGESPSFETLAREITSDVHPRSLLDEMIRLHLAECDASGQRVTAIPEAQVPKGNTMRSVQILGANVGDHLSAAVSNVMGTGSEFFEQAIFANGLSEVSLSAARQLVVNQWRATFDHLVPALERLIEADRRQRPDAPRYRLRLGQYSFDAAEPTEVEPAPSAHGESDHESES